MDNPRRSAGFRPDTCPINLSFPVGNRLQAPDSTYIWIIVIAPMRSARRLRIHSDIITEEAGKRFLILKVGGCRHRSEGFLIKRKETLISLVTEEFLFIFLRKTFRECGQ